MLETRVRSTGNTPVLEIGSVLSGATQGSVLFAGPGGVFAQDNANFFWDDTNNRLGIGTTGPDAKLDVLSTTTQLRLTYTDGSVYTDLTTDSNGYFVPNPSGGKINFGNVDVGGRFNVFTNTSTTPVGIQSNGIVNGGQLLYLVNGNVVTGSIYSLNALANCTGDGIFGMQQNNETGSAVFDALVLGTGDAYARFAISGGQAWTLGLDNSTSDKFKISGSSALGTSDYFVADTSGNIGLGGAASFGATMAGGIALKNGTAPTGNVTDSFMHYAADQAAGNSAPHWRTENGDVIKLYKTGTYTPSNVTTDRSFDANSTTLDELADVLGSLIADLQLLGVIG